MDRTFDTLRTAAAPWRDRQRLLRCLGLLVVSLPLVALALAQLAGTQLFYWSGPFFILGVVAVLDLLSGDDRSDPPESARHALEREPFYRRLLYVTVALEYVSVAAVLWAVTAIAMPWYHEIGLALTLGVATAVTINTSHELGHRPSKLMRQLARIALIPAAYVHFHVEHNRGHHVRVATPDDPASARYGESFYRFLPRTLSGSFASAWRLERARLARSREGVFHPGNEVLQGLAAVAVVWGAALAGFGTVVLPVLLIQAMYGVLLLETVNYVEHYGLARRRDAEGRFEGCKAEHSWNSNSLVSNLLLYNLQRHSDHHANPMIPYQALRSQAGAPQLPAGYSSMIMCSHVPWLWFRVMNPRVKRHYGGDLRRANLDPAIRARLGDAPVLRSARD